MTKNPLYQTVPQSVSILAVSKSQPVEVIHSALKEGHRWFGENRIQEAAAKWPLLRQQYPDIRLHLIGSLQTNKAKKALELLDVIETVDRPSLIVALAKEWNNPLRITQKILIQVNTAQEPQKGGVMVENLAALVDLCQTHALPLTGLMCIPPVTEDPVPHFRLLADLAHKHSLTDLSMGMSHDYRAAIANGATWVRLGRAFFGKL